MASTSFSCPVLQDLRKRNEVFEDLIAFKDVAMTVAIDGNSELIAGELLDGGAFSNLGVQVILGLSSTSTSAQPGHS